MNYRTVVKKGTSRDTAELPIAMVPLVGGWSASPDLVQLYAYTRPCGSTMRWVCGGGEDPAARDLAGCTSSSCRYQRVSGGRGSGVLLLCKRFVHITAGFTRGVQCNLWQ
jgi:hypothetical protein